MTAAGAAAMGSTVSEGARALWTLTLVLGGTALALATLDSVPTWLHGEPRGVRRASSVEETERRLGQVQRVDAIHHRSQRRQVIVHGVRVQADEQGRTARARRGQERRHLAAGVGLGRRGHAVLEVEDERVGAGAQRLGHTIGSVAGCVEVGAMHGHSGSPLATIPRATMVRRMSLVPSPMAISGASR